MMSQEADELEQQLAVGRAKHKAFKEHAQEYTRDVEAYQAEVIHTRRRIKHAREQVGPGSPDAPAQQAAVEQLQQDQREQAMVRDGLRQDFKELSAEFAEIKKPENDIVEFSRKIRKLRRQRPQ